MKINSKYSLGDKVWYLSSNEVHRGVITFVKIIVSNDSLIDCEYSISDISFKANELFKTKEELLNTL